jgi:hypothetical protein
VESFGVTQTNLSPGAALCSVTHLLGLASGDIIIRAMISRPDMLGVDESRLIQIGPELVLNAGYAEAGRVTLTFPALAGRRCSLKSSTTLSGTDWDTVGEEIIGEGGDKTIAVAPQGGQRFYRVRALPQ